jgi:hypothetical protein
MGTGSTDHAVGVTEGVPPAWLAFYDNERDAEAKIVEATWPELVETLTTHTLTPCVPCKGKTCPSKKGLAFSPAPPTKAPRRADKNVEWIYLLVFDLDHVASAELEGVCDRLEGLESILYSTHSHQHGGPDDCCVRLVFPLLRPITPAEFYVLHSEVRRRYQLQWWRPGAAKISGADPVVKDVSRLFFMPTAPEGTTPLWGYSPGLMLDIETLLREAPAAARSYATSPAPSAPSAPTPSSPNEPVDMEALRQKLRDYKPRNNERDEGKIGRKELVRRVLAAEPLVKHEETGLRNDAVLRLGSIFGYVLPPSAPEEAVLELVRPSINALPVYPNDDENDALEHRYETFRLAWKRGIDAAEVQRVQFEAKKQADRELHRKLKKRFHIKGPESGSSGSASASAGSEAEGEEAESEEEEPDLSDWESLLLKSKKGDVWSVGSNAELVLDAHPEWRDRLRYNEFTKSPEFDEQAPVYIVDPEEAITGIQYWFQFEYRIDLSRIDVMTVIRHVAKKNSYNPIKDYLNELKWDTERRIDDWLVRYCGAVVEDEEGNDISQHVRRIGRRWLMSAVARAIDPGCKADTVLILEGEQGKKKSMVFEVLAGQKWFTDSPVHIGQKDAMQIVGTKWIIEMAELSSFHGSETEQQKQFFSSRVDTFRPPFGLTPADFPRHAVLGGTTNRTNYLNDETGNRRFWAAWCEKILIADLKRDRDQLWAEAVHYYKQGLECPDCKRQMASNQEDRCVEHRWWFDPKENEELEHANNQRLRVDYAEGIIDYLLQMKVEQRPTWMTMHDVCKILNITSDRIQSQNAAVSRALKFLRFEHKRILQDGLRMRVFETPPTILEAPTRTKMRGAPRKAQQQPTVGLA